MKSFWKRMSTFRYLSVVYMLLILVMFILPFFSFEGYSILKNTTSHLGAQNTPNAWIMNLVFIMLGIFVILETWRVKAGWHGRVLLSIFGFALIFTALFRHAPILADSGYDKREDEMHSLMATAVGFSFTVYCISSFFAFTRKNDKILALAMAVFSLLMSILMFAVGSFMGVWQRLMFIAAFGYLIWVLELNKKIPNS